jgi:hypothetical protein
LFLVANQAGKEEPMSTNPTIDLIAQCAEIPSFTTFEGRLIPFIEQFTSAIPGAESTRVAENNLVVKVPGNPAKTTIAITAHLDKINHFGKDWSDILPVSVTAEKIIGQLDDSVGVGLCLSIMQQSTKGDFPPMLFLFSEMEESNGLKYHPEWLRGGGEGVHSGLGAERISEYLTQNKLLPDQVITIDTTPLFKGEPGLAIYTDHWEKNGLAPTPDLISATEKVYKRFMEIDPGLLKYNNTNDYLAYGLKLNQDPAHPVTSIALEPAIFPYHQPDEKVFLGDIVRLEKCLVKYLGK